jgi:hypothetical protein
MGTKKGKPRERVVKAVPVLYDTGFEGKDNVLGSKRMRSDSWQDRQRSSEYSQVAGILIAKVLTYESIASGRCKDHEHCQRPFDGVRSQRCSERPGANPEVWEWEGALSIE